MNPVRKQRLLVVLAVLVGLGVACALMFYALRQNINLFYTPQQIAAGEAPLDAQMRVGGLVEPGTVIRNPETLDVTFVLTDGKGRFTVHYQGILPDLFREGQGVVAIGQFNADRTFTARQILAKHDENYQPRELRPEAIGG
jgi:cytochrome c-type biogenesis protein CcmE